MLEFRILGPLEVVGEQGPIPLGGQKQRALLGGLVIRAGQVVSTDRLLDELWGEQPPKTATTSLQNMVSQLRKLLGADVLVTRPPGYVLQVEPDQVDAARFERLVADAAEGTGRRAREAPARGARALARTAARRPRVRALRRRRGPSARGAPPGTRSRSGSTPISSSDSAASSCPSSSRSSTATRSASDSDAS